MADQITVTALGEIESRMGIPSIESLLAERDELVKQVAPLRARHSSFGTYAQLENIQLATVAASIRVVATSKGEKLTEAAIKEASQADGRYVDFITLATQEKAEWAELENRITGIADTIRRGEAIAYYLSSEARLSR